MKILYISRRFYPEVKGGGQISAFHIAKSVQKLGHETVVCTFTEKKDKIETIDGLKIYRLHIPELRLFPRLSNMDYMYLQMAKLASKIIKKTNPDIIHLLNFESIPLSSIYYKKRFRKPVVATANGPQFGCFTGSGLDYKNDTCINCRILKRGLCSANEWGKLKGSAFYLYSIWYMEMLRFSYRYVDKFFPISRAMALLLQNMGVRKRKIKVIHNPIGQMLKADKSKLQSLRKRYRHKKIIICASRLTKEKGVQYTLEALKYLPDNYILLIAGWGNYEAELRELSNRHKIKDRVIFLGRINNREMGTYYKLADVFSHFPTFYEPFGRAIIESMNMGTPVIAYPIAGIKDIVEYNKNGSLVNSRNPEKIAEKIKSLIINKDAYARYSKQGIETVKEKFTNNVIGNAYIKEYKKVLEQD